MALNPGILANTSIAQVAIVVKDIEKTSRAFAALLGVEVPAWSITDTVDQAHTSYHQQPTPAQAKLAFFDLGGAQLELIEPVGGPSVWKDFLDQHGEGVQHIAFKIPDMGEQVSRLDENGMPLVQRGDFTGGSYGYIDSTKQLGVMLELLEF
jgi:methylmalonyl-CoA/ethylmalonyl-CoA epimerase